MKKREIIIVDDEPDLLKVLEKRLTNKGLKVYKAFNGEEALAMIKKVLPDLVILDIVMPGIDGMKVRAKLSKDKLTIGIPVIFLTVKDMIKDKVAGFSLGIDDYVTKPFDTEELLARINSVLNRRKFYEKISMTDGLTGLHNRYFFKKQIALFVNLAKRYKQIFSLVLIDIDNLKAINDTFGHSAGDLVLKRLSSIMRGILRKADVITRYGGDEFAIILPKTNKEQAHQVIKKIKHSIENAKFTFKNNGSKLSFSISSGIAICPDDSINEAQLFNLADTNMYKDKQLHKEIKGAGSKVRSRVVF